VLRCVCIQSVVAYIYTYKCDRYVVWGHAVSNRSLEPCHVYLLCPPGILIFNSVGIISDVIRGKTSAYDLAVTRDVNV